MRDGAYLLFAGESHYPAGGWADFRGQFSSLADAIAHAEELAAMSDQRFLNHRHGGLAWWHVVHNAFVVVEASRNVRCDGYFTKETVEITWERSYHNGCC